MKSRCMGHKPPSQVAAVFIVIEHAVLQLVRPNEVGRSGRKLPFGRAERERCFHWPVSAQHRTKSSPRCRCDCPPLADGARGFGTVSRHHYRGYQRQKDPTLRTAISDMPAKPKKSSQSTGRVRPRNSISTTNEPNSRKL